MVGLRKGIVRGFGLDLWQCHVFHLSCPKELVFCFRSVTLHHPVTLSLSYPLTYRVGFLVWYFFYLRANIHYLGNLRCDLYPHDTQL